MIFLSVSPVIVTFKDNITVNESQALALPCSATGYPQPVISWYKKDGSLPDGRFEYNSQHLTISNIKYEDRGEYVCTASNTVGAVWKTARVMVQRKSRLSNIQVEQMYNCFHIT